MFAEDENELGSDSDDEIEKERKVNANEWPMAKNAARKVSSKTVA